MCKIVILKIYAKFTGKHNCRNHYFNEYWINRGSSTGLFQWTLRSFSEKLEYLWTTASDCSFYLHRYFYILKSMEYTHVVDLYFSNKLFWEFYWNYFWLLALFLCTKPKFCKNIYRLNYYENDKHVRVFIVRLVVFILLHIFTK